MRNRSDWVLLGGWLAVAAAAVVGSLLLFVCSCAGSSLIGTVLSREIGVVIALTASILIACTAYGAGVGWAQGRVVEAIRPAWRGSGFADAWCLATATGCS